MVIDIKYWHSLLDVGDARLKFSIPVFPKFYAQHTKHSVYNSHFFYSAGRS